MPAATPSPADILATRVAFDTTGARSNLPLIDWVQAFAQSHGAAVDRIVDETGGKAALWITVGPDAPGYVLSGHSDVVPVAGQAWTRDPFWLAAVDGRLYGRGTSDMTAPDSDRVTLAKRLGGRSGHAKVSFGTEAGLFRAMGDVPAVVIGPGSIARARRADEYVETAEREACTAFVRRLVAASCTG